MVWQQWKKLLVQEGSRRVLAGLLALIVVAALHPAWGRTENPEVADQDHAEQEPRADEVSEAVDAPSGDEQLLARMIAAEAEGEPYRGMVAVGAVVVNRLNSRRFPNAMQEVLFQPGQFQPVSNGRFWRVRPTGQHLQAAREALAGGDPTNGAFFFFAPRKTRNAWIGSRPVVMDIGSHRFTR